MHVKHSGENLRINCEMINRASKDNGFIVGTFFKGKIRERNGETEIKGIILTAPLYHLIWFTLLALLVWQCIMYVAISALPILFVAFEIIMFSGEFKKQGYIKRYLMRAAAKMNSARQKNGL